ncbi:FAD-binding oxidoreductase [Nocardioides sp. cx-169]|uniref:FAD-dependent oxidoreductase n=1 Tax=Nocardioides sp. cx-169 TaxID=2899080 RepID=UPI001E2D9040|nr:FAD-dependent oxidoreductase [Nocardioides sp. cx-169]MCD4534424.1 FAD-binding oxidoreductase [Nocardioides sp. cx-169]
MRVIVVGAGVVGLSCAVRLLEAGHRVDVVARDLPLETTSAVAAALCHVGGEPVDPRAVSWSARSGESFAALAAARQTGVRMVPGTELPSGRSLVAPVAEMPRYLSWLRARVEALGGTVTRLNLRTLPIGGDAVVNCSGIGSRLLAADASITPVRGQVVHLEQHGLDRWWLGAGPEAPYIVPREHDIVVGGTHEHGDWSRTPSPDTAALLIERASRLVPELGCARVLQHRVGLRPTRPSIRLEREGRVVHCYGHGDAGIALSWGCADDVVSLLA